MRHRTEPPQKNRYGCCGRKKRYRNGVEQPCPHCEPEPPKPAKAA